MDRKIYRPANQDFGVYKARRIPKSNAIRSDHNNIEGRQYIPPDNMTFAGDAEEFETRVHKTSIVRVPQGSNAQGGLAIIYQVPYDSEWFLYRLTASFADNASQNESFAFNVIWMREESLIGGPLLVGAVSPLFFPGYLLAATPFVFTETHDRYSFDFQQPLLLPPRALICMELSQSWSINNVLLFNEVLFVAELIEARLF